MVKSTVEKNWDVTVVAVTSDASGESRKAQRLTAAQHHELVVPDCYAHQVTFCKMQLLPTLTKIFSVAQSCRRQLLVMRDNIYQNIS